jgi:uncharacterized SAM-binding protein YcdF (DUF218 family)
MFLLLSFLRGKLPLVTVTVLYSMLRRSWIIRSSLSLSLIVGVLVFMFSLLVFLLAEHTETRVFILLSFLRRKLPLVTVTLAVLYSMLRRSWIIRSGLSLSLILGLVFMLFLLFLLLVEQTEQTAVLVLRLGHTNTILKKLKLSNSAE